MKRVRVTGWAEVCADLEDLSDKGALNLRPYKKREPVI